MRIRLKSAAGSPPKARTALENPRWSDRSFEKGTNTSRP